MQTRYLNQLDEPSFAFEDIDATLTINGRPLHASVLAVAPRELKLRVPLFCPRWASVGIRMSRRYSDYPTHAVGEIHWFERSGTGWELGVWLDEPMSDDFLCNYWQDMRRELRYDVNWAAVAQWPTGRKQTVQVVGYSIGGLTISCSKKLKDQSQILLWRSFDSGPAVAGGIIKWTSEVSADNYLMGCMLPGDGGYDLARAFLGNRSRVSLSAEGSEKQIEIAKTLLRFPNH